MTNALAYYSMELITSVKCFIVEALGLNVVKFFTTTIYECLSQASLYNIVSYFWIRPGAHPRVEHGKVLHSDKLRPYSKTLNWAGKAFQEQTL